MAIDFGYNQYALFKVLGKIAAVIENQDANVALQNTAMSSQSAGIIGQLTNEPDVQAIIGGGYIGALSSLGGSLGPLMQQIASAAVNRIVFRDNPQQGQTLQSGSTLASLREIIRQMKQQNAFVLAMTVTATPSSFTGAGNPQIVMSVKRPFDGLALENSFAETLNVVCSADSYVGGATAGNETMLVTSAGPETDVFAYDWPQASGLNTSLSCIDGTKDNSAGNLLTNSGWESFTDDAPDNWEVVAGTAGTDFTQNTGITYDGLSALELIGDGTTLVRLRQVFNDGGDGTPSTLGPLAQFSFCGWFRRDGVAPAAGTLRISLKDANGTIIKDANQVENTFDIDLTNLSTTWTAYTGVFRMPLVVPSVYYLEVETTTALTSGRSVYLDRFGLGGMRQLYVSGPFAAVHSGSVPLQVRDYATIAVTNSRGAAGTLSTWQTVFARLFQNEMISNELLLPSAASPSVPDSWIA